MKLEIKALEFMHLSMNAFCFVLCAKTLHVFVPGFIHRFLGLPNMAAVVTRHKHFGQEYLSTESKYVVQESSR